MRINGYQIRFVSLPAAFPVVSSVRESKEIMFVLLDVTTDEGINGLAYAQGFHAQGCRAIQACLDLVLPQILGEDASQIERVWNKLWQSIKLLGRQGLAAFALSMVDMALWDIEGKTMNRPVFQVLGGTQTTLEAYASDALWLVSPIQAAQQAEQLVLQGFSTIKMRFGRKDEREDIRAIAEVRQAVGEQIEILCDVNQGWSTAKTADMSRRIAEYRPGWLEEPIDAEDSEGHRELMKQIGIPIATGENLYALHMFKHFLQLDCASVYTPDLQRIGGVTGWRKVNELLEASGAEYTLHLFPEFSSHLLAAANRPRKLEWVSWASSLFLEPLQCENGVVQVSNKPGFGLVWDEKAISNYSVF